MRSLRRLVERIRNVPGFGRDVVTLAVLVVIAIAATGYMLSQYGWRAPWDDEVLVAAEFEKAPAVRPESRQEVRIAGVTVGKVVSAEPLPNGHARLVLSLEPGHPVYSNARAVLRSKSPVNLMYIALDPGGPPGTPLPEGGTIPASQTARPVQPFEVLNKLDERTQSALTSLINESDAALATAPRHLPAGLHATTAAMSSFQPVVTALRTRRETIAELVTSLARISSAIADDDRRLARLTSSLQQSLAVLAERGDDMSAALAQLPGFTGDLKQAMTSTGRLTTQLNPTLDSLHQASGKLPPALSRLTDTVEQADGLIAAAAPVVDRANPVVADLRPLARDANAALGDLAPVTDHLPSTTKRLVPWLDDLAAFVYQTSSAFSLSDANGGLGRANINLEVLGPSDDGTAADNIGATGGK